MNAYELTTPLDPAAIDSRLAAYPRLQCATALTAADCAVLDPYLQAHPDTLLRVYPGRSGRSPRPAFLARLPSLRNLWLEASAGDLIDLAPLAHLPPGLRTLTLDTVAYGSDPKLDRPKQAPEALGALRELEELSLCGRLRSLDFLRGLPGLRRLELWRTRLAGLQGIEACSELRALHLVSTGAADLAPLAALAELRSLHVERQRGLVGMRALTVLSELRQLRLLACQTEEELPSFAHMRSLRVAVVEKLVTPQNLERIAAAPELRCLILPGSPQLHDVDALRPLAGHPHLQELRLESWNEKLYAAIHEAYGWKVEYCNYPAEEYL